jgi:hypothetical protein
MFMKGKKKLPIGAVPRACVCGKQFKAMTPAMWKQVLSVHLLTSKKHNPL